MVDMDMVDMVNMDMVDMNMVVMVDMVDMDMVDMDMVEMDTMDMDIVDMDMVDEDNNNYTEISFRIYRKFLFNFIYLGRLPRIISRTCLDSLVLFHLYY